MWCKYELFVFCLGRIQTGHQFLKSDQFNFEHDCPNLVANAFHFVIPFGAVVIVIQTLCAMYMNAFVKEVVCIVCK